MSKYSLWFDSLENVQLYEMKFLNFPKKMQEDPIIFHRFKICKCLQFQIDKQVRDKFFIEEIDSLLAGYKNEGDFRNALRKYYKTYDIHAKESLIATYKMRDEIKQVELVYDSQLLQKYALLERRRKKKSIKNRQLPKSEELRLFYLSLLKFVEDENKRELLLHPLQLPYQITLEEAQSLNHLLPSNGYKAACTLRDVLEEYAYLIDLRKRKEERFLSTSEEDAEIKQKKSLGYDVLCQNYTTLRKTILFMKKCNDFIQRDKTHQEQINSSQLKLFSNKENELYYLDDELSKKVEEDLRLHEEYQEELFEFSRDLDKKRKEKYGDGSIIDETDDYSFKKVNRWTD